MVIAWLIFMSGQLYHVVSIQENCEAIDSRGAVWQANPAQWSTTNCSSVDQNLGNVKNFYQVSFKLFLLMQLVRPTGIATKV